MAVNTSRSMNASLDAGRSDGSLRKPNPDRCGEIDAATVNARVNLHPEYGYGFIGREGVYVTGEEYLPR